MNNVIKLEPNKTIETKFCFEVECHICKTTFIMIPNSDKKLECCPYCGHDFFKEPERIEYSHGIYSVTKNMIVTPYPNNISIESINIDNIETNNTYSIECGHCNESYIIDCGEDKKPSFCPYCKSFYVADEFVRKIKANSELTYSYDNARFGSFPHIVYDMDFYQQLTTDLIHDDDKGE